jgi:hypothetical protein
LITLKNRLQLQLKELDKAASSDDPKQRAIAIDAHPGVLAKFEEVCQQVDRLKDELRIEEEHFRVSLLSHRLRGVEEGQHPAAVKLLKERAEAIREANLQIDREIHSEILAKFADRRREAIAAASKPFDDAIEALRSGEMQSED